MEHGSFQDNTQATFSLTDEDHTLANSLRFTLNQDPRVTFCGYSIPHPSDARVNIRVQTTGDSAREVLKDSCQDLMLMCEHRRINPSARPATPRCLSPQPPPQPPPPYCHMGFFDLNIPYHESDRHVNDKSSLKSRRLKLALKTMEFGYTGIAYNRILRGVMSDSDRCSTPLFPISSILKLVPSSSALSEAVKYHRELLNVAVSTPFRQYTRITVVVDSPSQVAAINAGNPVLKSYDITAVRPLNQNTFDHACQTSEVDIIAINFSEKLPFRLKQPMVKAAIKRGVYFEITYSGLIGDVQSRRLMISNSKMLVDWTRGKNVIFSSAASSVLELRGPQDVSNLFSLLGLSMEHAKAAISKNCRSLLSTALRKKQFYKEAVKVEEITSHANVNTEQPAFDEWLKWDPISSGQGDLPLDDMEKSFSLSSCTMRTIKTIDFTSSKNDLPAHGLQVRDLITGAKAVAEPPVSGKYLSDAMEIEEAVAVCEKPEEEANGFDTSQEKQGNQVNNENDCHALSRESCGTMLLPECRASSFGVAVINSESGLNKSKLPLDSLPKKLVSSIPLSEDGQASPSYEKIRSQVSGSEDSAVTPKDSGYSDVLEADILATETQCPDRKSQIFGGRVLSDSGQVHVTTVKDESITITENYSSVHFLNPSIKSSISALQVQESNVKNSQEASIYPREAVVLDQVSNTTIGESRRDQSLASSGAAPQDYCMKRKEYKEMTYVSVALSDKLRNGPFNLATTLNDPILENLTAERRQIDSVAGYQGNGKSLSGGKRRRRNARYQPFLFYFKHFLRPSHCKRKAWKLRPLTSV